MTNHLAPLNSNALSPVKKADQWEEPHYEESLLVVSLLPVPYQQMIVDFKVVRLIWIADRHGHRKKIKSECDKSRKEFPKNRTIG